MRVIVTARVISKVVLYRPILPCFFNFNTSSLIGILVHVYHIFFYKNVVYKKVVLDCSQIYFMLSTKDYHFFHVYV